MASHDSDVAVAYPNDSAYPISYEVVYPERLSRRNGVKRAAGMLVTWLVPAGLGYVSAVFNFWLAVSIASLIAGGVIGLPLVLAARIRAKGSSPFLEEDGPVLERYASRSIAMASYALFLTDASPDEAMGRSVKLEIRRGGEIGWLHAAITPVLLLPHILLLAFFAFAFMLIVPVCAVFVLAFQRYPRPFFGFTVGYLRWISRALGYWISLTDRYPPFSFAGQA
jgi:hypothetical protein